MQWLKGHFWQLGTAVFAALFAAKAESVNSDFQLSDQMFQWIANNGFAVVVAIFLMYMLRLVILDATRYFTTKLDQISTDQQNAFRDVANANRALVQTLERQTSAINDMHVVMEQMHEGLKTMLLFLSHTQQEVVAHRAVVEPMVSPSEAPSINAMLRKE